MSIDDTGGMLYVRIDGERWRNLPSIPVARLRSCRRLPGVENDALPDSE